MSIYRLNTTEAKKSLRFLIFTSILFCNAMSCSASEKLSNAKDMFYEELKDPSAGGTSIAYCLELRRGNAKPILCNNRYSFRSGDGVRLHVKTSNPVYAYIYLSEGSGGEKAILYPPPGSKENNKIEAGKEYLVPPRGMVVFDSHPGTEKLTVVFSPQPLSGNSADFAAPPLINSDTLTGIPQKLGTYSIYSNDGVYASEQNAPGNGLVYVHNPDSSKPTAVGIVLDHASADSPLPPPAKPPTPGSSSTGAFNRPVTDKWAFIVGIDVFANFPHSSLQYCVSDATSFRDFLINEAGFKPNHVYFLSDEQATTRNINRVISELLPRAVRPDDLLLTYFSTHGSPTLREKNYVVTHDFDGKGKTGIAMQELGDTIKSKISSDRIVMILDTCFSGNARDLDQGELLDELLQGCGQIIVSSCGANEKALEDSKLGHGYFTYYLIDSLRKVKGLKQGFDLTSRQVSQLTELEHKHSQHPVIKYDRWRGNDLVLFAKPSSPRN